MQVLTRPARVLIVLDHRNEQRTLMISEGWGEESWRGYCRCYNWRPLYIVNLKPKGVEYEKCDG
jgi:hypothetical protein